MALLFVRHGSTGANAGDSDARYGFTDKDYFRGWTQLPLSPDGVKALQQTADWLKQVPLQAIISSDLPRAAQSAQLISKATGAPVKLDPRLRSMDIGQFTEQEITPERKKLFEYAQDKRNVTLPGGTETYNDFMERYKSVLPELLQMGQNANVAVVTHHRNILALPEIFHNQRAKVTDDTLPGSVSVLTPKAMKVLYQPTDLKRGYAEKARS